MFRLLLLAVTAASAIYLAKKRHNKEQVGTGTRKSRHDDKYLENNINSINGHTARVSDKLTTGDITWNLLQKLASSIVTIVFTWTRMLPVLAIGKFGNGNVEGFTRFDINPDAKDFDGQMQSLASIPDSMHEKILDRYATYSLLHNASKSYSGVLVGSLLKLLITPMRHIDQYACDMYAFFGSNVGVSIKSMEGVS